VARGAGLLAGIAAGGMVAMKAKDRKEAREKRAASRSPSTPPEQLGGPEYAAPEGYTPELEELGEGKANGGVVKAYQDGGSVDDLDQGPPVKGYKGGRHKFPIRPGEGDVDVLGEVKDAVARLSSRDSMAKSKEPLKGHSYVDTLRDEDRAKGRVPKYADGGVIEGERAYANGGLLYAPPGLGNSVTGYVQHGSTTQTTDPLWHAECHRDYGKKG